MNPVPKTREYRVLIPTTVETLWAFHAQSNAFKKLTPPPVFIQLLHNSLTSLTEGEVEFNLWIGIIPVRWIARHEPGPTETSFLDRQIKGPLALWEHRHIFEKTDDGAILIDCITLSHKAGWRGLLTRLFFDGPSLKMLFLYRHWRTRLGVKKLNL